MSKGNIAVIFDMDGVLIDSVKYNWQALNEVLGEYGVHVSDEHLPKYIGRPLTSQLQQLSDENKVELNYDTINERATAIKQVLFENIEPKEGVLQLLELLKEKATPIAIATSNSRDTTIQRLTAAGIISYFDKIVTESDVTEHKPNPAVYLEAARQLDVSPLDCVVFEDAPAGVQSAKNAKMTCIAVQTPFANTDDLKLADAIVSSLANVNVDYIKDVLSK